VKKGLKKDVKEIRKEITVSDFRLDLLFGPYDENLKLLAQYLGLRISARGNKISLRGAEAEVARAERILTDLSGLLEEGHQLTRSDVYKAMKLDEDDGSPSIKKTLQGDKFFQFGNKRVMPRSGNQKKYLDAMADNDIVFGIGPAGTGKTYLAVAAALDAFASQHVKRIVLSRPALEAGERLGFLPGDMLEKVDPYLGPLYDALHDLMGRDRTGKLQDRGIIEIAPLAFMRGRTLSDAFIILDEAQNTTSEQMKMFLTRLGVRSKAVITGDITQIDLPRDIPSGLVEAQRIVDTIDGTAFVYFDETDVVRHPLVKKIITAYSQFHKKKGSGPAPGDD
jgi:phosphate starvation-inducible PhoH-like protein